LTSKWLKCSHGKIILLQPLIFVQDATSSHQGQNPGVKTDLNKYINYTARSGGKFTGINNAKSTIHTRWPSGLLINLSLERERWSYWINLPQDSGIAATRCSLVVSTTPKCRQGAVLPWRFRATLSPNPPLQLIQPHQTQIEGTPRKANGFVRPSPILSIPLHIYGVVSTFTCQILGLPCHFAFFLSALNRYTRNLIAPL
jgi:hypothetical protein